MSDCQNDISERIRFEQALSCEIVQRERGKAELAMWTERFRADMGICKAQEIAKTRVDAQREAECLQDVIEIDEAGCVSYKRRFFRKEEGRFSLLNVFFVDAFWIRPAKRDAWKKKILLIEFRRSNASNDVEAVYLKDFSVKTFSKKIREKGISFRAPERRYKTLAEEFLRICAGRSQEVYVPEYRGFYRCEGKLCYASESDLIWEDVERLCG